MKYAVVIGKSETGCSAYVPDLPGCSAVGTTLKRLTAIPLAFAVAMLSISTSAAAPHPSPEELVSLYYLKLGEADMTALADYMHGAELAKFREMMLPVFEAGFAAGGDPGPLRAFTRGDTLQQVQAYSPKEFFSRFLRWVMVMKPGMDQVLKQSSIKPIGHVAEQSPDGEVIHVVFRMTSRVEGVTVSKLSVMSLQKDGEAWKLLLTGEIEGVAQALQRQMKSRDPGAP